MAGKAVADLAGEFRTLERIQKIFLADYQWRAEEGAKVKRQYLEFLDRICCADDEVDFVRNGVKDDPGANGLTADDFEEDSLEAAETIDMRERKLNTPPAIWHPDPEEQVKLAIKARFDRDAKAALAARAAQAAQATSTPQNNQPAPANPATPEIVTRPAPPKPPSPASSRPVAPAPKPATPAPARPSPVAAAFADLTPKPLGIFNHHPPVIPPFPPFHFPPRKHPTLTETHPS